MRRTLALLLCTASLTACAPRLFVTETPTLDGASVQDASIRYEPMQDCWWKRMIPTRYVIERADYRIELVMGAGHEDASPQIEIAVSGATGPSIEFPGLGDAPQGQKTDTGWTYEISTAAIQGDLQLRVLARGDYLGQEQFSIKFYRCHGLGFGGA